MEIEIVLEKHERRIDELEHEMAGLKAVQNEIRTMNETLCVLTNEIKHTNLHLERHERKLDEMEAQPSKRLHQIVTALISSICGALIFSVVCVGTAVYGAWCQSILMKWRERNEKKRLEA